MRADDLNSVIRDTHKLKTMSNIRLSNKALLLLRFYICQKHNKSLKSIFDIARPSSPKHSLYVCVCVLVLLWA